MAARRKASETAQSESHENIAVQYEMMLQGMERQKENAREMARRARQMYDQAVSMREQAQRGTRP